MSGRAPLAVEPPDGGARTSRRVAAAVVLLGALAAACRTVGSHRKPEPLGDEGEVHVYLEPFRRTSPDVRFVLAAVSALAADGTVVSLPLRTREVEASPQTQRLLAVGRVPPGGYAGLVLVAERASLDRGGERTALHVPPEGTRVGAPFTVSKGRATVLSLSLDPARSVDRGFAFAPDVAVEVPAPPVPGLTALCSATGGDALTVLDRHARRAVAVLPTGRDPMGVALDEASSRAYVALAGEDRIEVLDVLSGAPQASILLRPGDRPRDVALGSRDRSLVVMNAGSETLSFVDLGSLTEIDRVRTGLDPVSIVMDGDRRRAYVVNRGSSSVTVVDLVARVVAATLPTEAEPVRAIVDRAGTRLHVVHAGSPYLLTFALPELAPAGRTFVGGRASALAIDPGTGLLLVGRSDDDRLEVLDPASLMPIRWLELPGPAAALAVDDVENVVFAVIPDRQAVSATDLVGGRLLSIAEVGAGPYQLVVAGGRR